MTQIVAILSPGEMGGGVGAALARHGHEPIACLAGRGAETVARAERLGFRLCPDLDSLVAEADIVLSILPPEAARAVAEDVAAAMRRTGKRAALRRVQRRSPRDRAGDRGLLRRHRRGFHRRRDRRPAAGRGAEAHAHLRLRRGRTGHGRVRRQGHRDPPMRRRDRPRLGGQDVLRLDLQGHQRAAHRGDDRRPIRSASATSCAPRSPIPCPPSSSACRPTSRACRPMPGAGWREMEEIARTYASAGLPPGFHLAAAEIFRLLDATPYGSETPRDHGPRALDGADRRRLRRRAAPARSRGVSARLRLADGRALDVAIRSSARARRIQIKVAPVGGAVELVLPPGAARDRRARLPRGEAGMGRRAHRAGAAQGCRSPTGADACPSSAGR